MEEVRKIRLYVYFMQTLMNSLDELYSIKKSYVDDKISYKRAHKRMFEELEFAWSRYRLCDRLEVGDPDELKSALNELRFLTEWVG